MSEQQRTGDLPRHLWLVRHGETEGLSSIRLYGRTDVPLSERGREMARLAAEALGSVALGGIFTSRLRRSYESAEILALRSPAPIHRVADFDEVDFGRWEGLTTDEVRRGWPDLHRVWCAGSPDFAYPGGESVSDFHRRVGAAAARILANPGAGDLAFVLHKGVIKSVFAHVLGLPFYPLARMFEVDLGSISRIRLGAERPLVIAWNQTHHLEGASKEGGGTERGRGSTSPHPADDR